MLIIRNRKTTVTIGDEVIAQGDIPPEAIESIGPVTHLTASFMNLRNNALVIANIVNQTSISKTLKKLDLSYANLNDSDAIILSNTLRDSKLNCIKLDGNLLTVLGAGALATILHHNKDIKSLSVKDNDLGTAGASTLVNAAKSLRILNLSDNNIGVEYFAMLAGAVAQNPSLVSLDLSHNKLGGLGVTLLCGALLVNTNLQNLVLSDLNCGIKGFKSIVELLTHNLTIRSIDLSFNKIPLNKGTKELIGKFIQALQNNSIIQSVNLSCNDIAPDVIQRLKTKYPELLTQKSLGEELSAVTPFTYQQREDILALSGLDAAHIEDSN